MPVELFGGLLDHRDLRATKCPIGVQATPARGSELEPTGGPKSCPGMRPMPPCRRRSEAEQNVFPRVTNVPLIMDVAGSFWTLLDFSIVLRSRRKSLNVSDFSTFFLVLPDRIELSTSPLPRE
jgi:hypothetical protein